MKKYVFTIIFVSLLLSFLSIKTTFALDKNIIQAVVEIKCPSKNGQVFRGSGTIIDPQGIILTNKHILLDNNGQIIFNCRIGFINNFNQEASFFTKNKPNKAVVKYYTNSKNLDLALLYLESSRSIPYPFVDITKIDANQTNLGEEIKIVGYPLLGGDTITYTQGVFSGFGSIKNNTQNYLKTTTPIEHGNSGGAVFNAQNQFLGVPTMVVKGSLFSLSYFLSVNSVRNWIENDLNLSINQKTKTAFPIEQCYQTKAKEGLAGRIIIQTEQAGQAYYINPVDRKAYYLGRPSDAFNIMKNLGLGISNQDLQNLVI